MRNVLGAGTIDRERHLRCGFVVPVSGWQDGIKLGFLVDGVVVWAYRLQFAAAAKVQEGRYGWLFLDNDANKSVDQYCGRRCLSDNELELWRQYFSELGSLSRRAGFQWRFLLVPAKEYVVPQFYPHQAGQTSPVDQFLSHFGDMGRIVWPLPELRSAEYSYWKGDTHWSDYGAAIGAREVLASFNIADGPDPARQAFVVRRSAGDLGSKVVPPVRHSYLASAENCSAKPLVFDNGIVNHGRIKVWDSVEGKNSRRCVIFGGSSSANFVQWILPVFDRVVFAHTAGAIDRSIVEVEKPTHVLIQSNSRFIVNPPQNMDTLRTVIVDKLRRQKDGVKHAAEQIYVDPSAGEEVNFYSHLMAEAIDAAGSSTMGR